MHPSRRLRGRYPQAAAHIVATALILTALLAAVWPGPARASARQPHPAAAHSSRAARTSPRSPTSQPSHRGWVKYYIVQPPKDGNKEFLYEIAVKTLGDGSRSAEIFKLNKGRLQPGGGRLEYPTVILPGWILVLPASAAGPGVHYGPLPVVPSPSPSVTVSPTVSAAPATSHHNVAAAPGSRSPRLSQEDAEIGGAVLIAILLAAGLPIMRRHRRNAVGRPGRTGRPGRSDRRRANRPAGPGRPVSNAPAPMPPGTMLASSGPPRELGDGRSFLAPVIPPATIGSSAGTGDPAAALGTLTAADAAPGAARPAALSYPAWLDGPAGSARSDGRPDGAAPGWSGIQGAFADADVPVAAAAPPPAAVSVRPDSPAVPATATAPATPTEAAGPAATAASATPAPPGGEGEDGELPWPDFLALAVPGPAAATPPGTDVPPVIVQPMIVPPVAVPAVAVPAVTGAVVTGAVVTGGASDTTAPAGSPEPPVAIDDAAATIVSGPADDGAQIAATESRAAGFSPVALRILGAQRSSAQLAATTDVPAQRHQVALGDDRIEVVLSEAPAASHDGKPRGGRTWLTATPYLVWAPLPYDAPDDGLAFACVGAGDEGCLFIDLAAAPGAVAIGGDSAAATRLAESIAHQLCMAATTADRSCVVIVVGAVLPEPHPAGAAWVATVRDLGSAVTDGTDDGTEIVFCDLRSNEDAFALARYVASTQRHVVPVVLADLPDAPWSFTAHPSLRPNEALYSVIA
ncbi:MAG TPA: hypothetical protein VMV07_10475 [Streptosporangiaceae bacterium]|nr:hypothetical protein [Streptosporangiaceae bacterium]